MVTDLKNYPNPLDEFRTYSYHFILTLASSTEALRRQLQPTSGQQLYSRVQAAGLGEEIKLDDNYKVYLVLDTRRFSQFSITEFEAEHVYGMGDVRNPAMPVSTVRMKVIDTTGFNFFPYMMDLMQNKVRSTRASAFFLLNIIFIGHRPDNTTQIISTCFIPLILVSMDAEMTAAGGEHNIEFIETEGGLQRGSSLWQFNSLGTKVTAMTHPGQNSLASLVQALEDQLNWNSARYYQNYINETLRQTGRPGAGKLVQYMFNLPSEWSGDNFKVTAAAVTKRLEQRFKATDAEAPAEATKADEPTFKFEKDSSVQMSFSEKTTIVDALTRILESCEQVLDLASAKARAAGTAQTFKVALNITSDDNVYIIHADVYPYPIHRPPERNLHAQNFANHIYYEYLFPGENNHIEDFKLHYLPESAMALDTKVSLGTWRLAVNAAQGQTERGAAAAAVRTVKSRDATTTLREGDPVFPNALTVDQQTNFSALRDAEQFAPAKAQELVTKLQEFRSTLAYYHFISSFDAELTIRGNPNLLRKYADRLSRGGIAPSSPGFTFSVPEAARLGEIEFQRRIRQAIQVARQAYRANYYQRRVDAARRGRSIDQLATRADPLENELDVLSYPIFVHLTIGSPNTDFDGATLPGVAPYTTGQFFNGPYYILSIKHTLADGDFKQQLSMIPFPDLKAAQPGAPPQVKASN